MDEALARTRADLRAIRDANEVVVSVIAVLVVEIFSRGYEQGLDGLSRLRRKSSACDGIMEPTIHTITMSPAAISRPAENMMA